VTSRRVIEDLAKATETALQILRDAVVLLEQSERQHREAAEELTEEVRRRQRDGRKLDINERRSTEDDA
jgi:DNA-binding protein H-NS